MGRELDRLRIGTRQAKEARPIAGLAEGLRKGQMGPAQETTGVQAQVKQRSTQARFIMLDHQSGLSAAGRHPAGGRAKRHCTWQVPFHAATWSMLLGFMGSRCQICLLRDSN